MSSHLAAWDKKLNGQNGFDVARLIFATLVVFEHSYFLPFDSYRTEPLHIFSNGQTDFGSLAVDGFFAISGFLITRSCLLTDDALRYFEKRVARIVPGFLLASCLGLLVFGPWGADSVASYFAHVNWRATIVKILSLHPSGGGETLLHNPMKSMVGGTLWTIRYEFDCYILVAILWSFGLLRRGFILALLLGLLLASALQSRGIIVLPVVNHGISAIFLSSPDYWPRLFGYFFAGSAFYLWRESIPKSSALMLLSIVALLLAIKFGGAEAAMLTAGIYILFFAALSRGRTPRLFGRKVDLSYGIYLFGFPIQQLVIAASHQTIGPEMLFIVSFPLTCCVAYASWTLVESPSLQWVHRLRSRAGGTVPRTISAGE